MGTVHSPLTPGHHCSSFKYSINNIIMHPTSYVLVAMFVIVGLVVVTAVPVTETLEEAERAESVDQVLAVEEAEAKEIDALTLEDEDVDAQFGFFPSTSFPSFPSFPSTSFPSFFFQADDYGDEDN